MIVSFVVVIIVINRAFVYRFHRFSKSALKCLFHKLNGTRSADLHSTILGEESDGELEGASPKGKGQEAQDQQRRGKEGGA